MKYKLEIVSLENIHKLAHLDLEPTKFGNLKVLCRIHLNRKRISLQINNHLRINKLKNLKVILSKTDKQFTLTVTDNRKWLTSKQSVSIHFLTKVKIKLSKALIKRSKYKQHNKMNLNKNKKLRNKNKFNWHSNSRNRRNKSKLWLYSRKKRPKRRYSKNQQNKEKKNKLRKRDYKNNLEQKNSKSKYC